MDLDQRRPPEQGSLVLTLSNEMGRYALAMTRTWKVVNCYTAMISDECQDGDPFGQIALGLT